MNIQKGIFVASFLVVIIAVGTVGIAHADAPTFEPPCADASCTAYAHYFEASFTIDNLNPVENVAYVYRGDWSIDGDNTYKLVTSTAVDVDTAAYKKGWSYIAFRKNQLKTATGSSDPMSIFTTKMVTGEFTDKVPVQDVISTSEVQNGLLKFVISKNDENIGLSKHDQSNQYDHVEIIDNKYIPFPDAANPYISVPVTSPIKQKTIFYSPLGIYNNKYIVLYESKEIQTLDDGSQKTISLPPPSTVDITPLNGPAPTAQAPAPKASVPVAAETPVEVSQPWWSGFWCFIKGIFGASC